MEILRGRSMEENRIKTPETLDHNRSAFDHIGVFVRSAWMSDLHIPGFLKSLMPQVAIQGLRRFKGRILTRGLPRHNESEQSLEDSLASASISIIVAIHDAPAVTRRCLSSLERYAQNSEIILVDDASGLTETLEVIQHFSDRNGWKVVRHEKARGHSEACRAGARLATRTYLCLLNSDTVVTPWCWRGIKEAFELDEKIGVAGPSTSSAGNVQALGVAADMRPYWNDNQICAFAKLLLIECAEPVVVDLPWVSGFALFIRRSLWEKIGGFDERLPDYCNEVELCRRVSDEGYRRVWVRTSYIHHLGRQSYEGTIGDEGIRERTRVAETYMREKSRPVASWPLNP
jgi:O-antigen biosynthesis protein